MISYTRCLFVCVALSLGGCVKHYDAFTVPDETYAGHYKVGHKYRIKKVRYAPCEVNAYDKTGMASWYGPGFYHNKTANGEIFTANDLTAAHPTLPLPCIVSVTNLLNNKSVLVRVNDRGPFGGKRFKRIIDISEYAAELLDMKQCGIAPVRVKFLPNATKLLHEKLDLNVHQK